MDIDRLTAILLRSGQGDDYVKALAAFQIERGWNRMDLTPEQTLRFRAIEKAGGDVRVAKHLTFGRLRYRRGVMTDGRR